MDASHTKSIPQLIGDAFSQFASLFQNEFALARAEVSEKLANAAHGAAFVAIGALLVLPALTVLMISIALMFVQWGLLTPPFAYLTSALLGLGAGGIIAAIGLNKLQTISVAPTLAIEQIKKDVATAKELVR